MRISVFGLGYVGCVSAVRLAEAGHQVIGVDINEQKTAMVNSGKSPIVEPGLADLLSSVVESGFLRASTDAAEALRNSDLAFVCVGTPGRENGKLDVSTLSRVSRDIGNLLRGRQTPFTVVIRSTILPGTTETSVLPLLQAAAGDGALTNLKVAVNPEFMREGTALHDYLYPPFTLVGCKDGETADLLREIYAGVDAAFVQTDIRTAEMLKYVANAFHALKICFANEIGDVCEAFDADQEEVLRIFRMDKKLNISEAYLRAGFAFGGSCLPKDVRALTYAARREDVPTPVLSTIMSSNDWQIQRAINKVTATRKRRIGLVGLSFKPDTDDLRESPIVSLAEALIGKGFQLRILDHNVSLARLTGANRKYIEEEIPHIASLMCTEPTELVSHADVVVIGNSGPETDEIMRLARTDQVIIDLTRSAWKGPVELSMEEIQCQESELSNHLLPSSSPQSQSLHS